MNQAGKAREGRGGERNEHDDDDGGGGGDDDGVDDGVDDDVFVVDAFDVLRHLLRHHYFYYLVHFCLVLWFPSTIIPDMIKILDEELLFR